MFIHEKQSSITNVYAISQNYQIVDLCSSVLYFFSGKNPLSLFLLINKVSEQDTY